MMHENCIHATYEIVVGGLVQPENPIPRRPAYVPKAAATRNAWADRSENLLAEASYYTYYEELKGVRWNL